MDQEEIIYKVGEAEMMVVREAALAGYQAERRFTYEDYRTWPDDERWELIDGIPFRMDSPSEYHQQISVNLLFALRSYLTGKSCKVYHAPFDVRLHIDGIKDTVVQPDVLVVCDKDILDTRWAKGAPDLVIEILSPSTAKKDQTLKLAKYEKHGVKEFWIVDPIRQKVTVYVLNAQHHYDPPVVFQSSHEVIHASVLSPFKMSLTALFTWENIPNDERFEEGVAQGIQQGEMEKARNIAKQLLAHGIPLHIIASSTGLLEHQLLALKSESLRLNEVDQP